MLRFLRIVSGIALVSVLVVVANLLPDLLEPPLLARLGPETFYGLALIMISLVWLRWSGTWRTMQSRGGPVIVELFVALFLAVGVTALLGLGLSPLDLCIGGGGGYVCYPELIGFLAGLLGLVSIVLAEELFFRAYLINELNQLLGWRGRAVLSSVCLFTLLHLPALRVEGFGAVSATGFLVVLTGAVTLSASYWYGGRNLVAVMLLHGYWDGLGALLLIPGTGLLSPFVTIVLQLSLPAAGLVLVHAFMAGRPPSSKRPCDQVKIGGTDNPSPPKEYKPSATSRPT